MPLYSRHAQGMSSKRQAAIFIIVSLLIHLLLASRLGSLVNLREEEREASPLELIPIELKPREEAKPEPEAAPADKRVVDLGQTPAPPEPEVEKEAQYLAERRMRTDKEQVAAFNPAARPGLPGPKTEGQAQAPPAEAPARPPAAQKPEEAEPLVFPEAGDPRLSMKFVRDKSELAQEKKQAIYPTFQQLAQADDARPGTVDLLRGLPAGEMTFLNADYYRFASFWNRLRKIGTFFWSREIQSLAYRVQLPSHDLTVLLHVAIYADGTLKSVEVSQSCGLPAVDRAAITTVQQMTPIFGIPKELLNDEELLEGIWGFTLYID